MEPFNGSDGRDPWNKVLVGDNTDGDTSKDSQEVFDKGKEVMLDGDGGSILDPWGGPVIPKD
ncbi:MAG: hypothetical protein QOH06_5058 [Acidobacteriota bacterium]|jgi:hypothetical protein|nr:hypothetical protein [Acidobacteriota bacterium]